MAQTTIAYLERRYTALESEIADALRQRPTDDLAIADLKYRNKLSPTRSNTIVAWSTVSANLALTRRSAKAALSQCNLEPHSYLLQEKCDAALFQAGLSA